MEGSPNMPIHTLQCTNCRHQEEVAHQKWPDSPILCTQCGEPTEIVWSSPNYRTVSVHPKERAVIWFNPRTGEHKTPGRNDVEMPARYNEQGYERREFEHFHELDKYCRQRDIINEGIEYDRNGRADREL